MALIKGESYVLGLDFGTDSCRAVIIDACDGSEAGLAVMDYPRWKQGLYSDAQLNQFRQHPLDYIETLEGTVKGALGSASLAPKIKGIAIDTTGSTPCAVDLQGQPLSLQAEFSDNPSAMFVLWKDHTAVEEAAAINHLAKTWGGTDFTRYVGGIYSSEWFWAKIMRVFKEDPSMASKAASFLEHCDWMTLLLTGGSSLAEVKRSRCAMGHKAMWHQSFEGGYPSEDFLHRLDPRLGSVLKSLGPHTYTSDTPAGLLSDEWAGRLGLNPGIPVAVGAYDAHMGAVGGGVKPGWLVRVMGTSTCDMIVGPQPEGKEIPVPGICGQVDGSVVPGMIGYEAGQSSFGDVYAWFRKLLMWPLEHILPRLDGIKPEDRAALLEETEGRLLQDLANEAAKIEPAETDLLALDWLNGRRSPDADPRLKGAITGLTLGTDAPRFYRALAEATAFGAKAIVERFKEEGVAIEGIIGVGGVARRSPFIMQILADVIGLPIHVPAFDQSVALGAAMFAAVTAGLYPDIPSAQEALCSPIDTIYQPQENHLAAYKLLYEKYQALGRFYEEFV